MAESPQAMLKAIPTPVSDNEARAAIHAIGGFAYQLLSTVVAWTDLGPDELLFVEVAEDYATATQNCLRGVQVKREAGAITLRSVADTINNYWTLRGKNPSVEVTLRYLTTASIGMERGLKFPGDVPGLLYWRAAAREGGDTKPIRAALKSIAVDKEIKHLVETASDGDLRQKLLRAIYWEVEQPQMGELRRLAEMKLVGRGRAITRATVQELKTVLDPALVRVLDIATKNADRVLGRMELDSIIEARTLFQVPTDVARRIMSAQFGEAEVSAPALAIDAAERPLPIPTAERGELLSELSTLAAKQGFLILHGGTGLGKSTLARLLVRRIGGHWLLTDMRRLDHGATRRKLTDALSLLHRGISGIILDDLPVEHDADIEQEVALLWRAARLSDALIIATCSRSPSSRLLSFLDTNSIVAAGNFSEKDVNDLISAIGGDATKWGAVTFMACGSGNPQLVHARVKRLAQLGWPETEMLGGIMPSLPASGVDDERTTVRRRLRTEVADDSSRSLLYRLSVVGGYFDRALALAIGAAPPPLTGAGERLDWMIGPWIEDLGRGYYRLTPLLGGAGAQVLAKAEIATIQHEIVDNLILRRPLDGLMLGTTFAHAYSSGHQPGLAILAALPVTGDDEKRSYIADQLVAMKYFRTDRPIFPANPYIGVLLRLAQFHVCVEHEDWKTAQASMQRLLFEVKELAVPELRDGFEVIALWNGLGEMRLPEPLPGWIDGILRIRDLVQSGSGEAIIAARSSAAELRHAEGLAMHQFLFAMNAVKCPTVEALETVFHELDQLPPKDRKDLLVGLEGRNPDYRLFTASAWLANDRRGDLDGRSAGDRYATMSAMSSSWGNRRLAIECEVARSVVLDEYAKDPDEAIKAIDNASQRLGADAALTRQKAKVLHRRGDDEEAIALLSGVADQLPVDDYVEIAFSMREAAISTARLGDWSRAVEFYQRARTAALRGAGDILVLAAGLAADLAWAQMRVGDLNGSISTLQDALREVTAIEDDSDEVARSTKALVGQVAARIDSWLVAENENEKSRFMLPPGACSRHEPIPDLLNREPVLLDASWHQLALVELKHTPTSRVATEISAWPAQRRMPSFQVVMAKERAEQSIRTLTLRGFASVVDEYAAAINYLHDKRSSPSAEGGAFLRGAIPPLGAAASGHPFSSSSVQCATLSMAVHAAAAGRRELLDEIAQVLEENFAWATDITDIATALRGGGARPGIGAVVLAQGLKQITHHADDLSPTDIFRIHCQVIDWVRRVPFERALSEPVGHWIIEGWRNFIDGQRFRLRMPGRTCPEIEAALGSDGPGLQRAGKVLLAAEDATHAELSPEFRRLLAEAGQSR